MPNESHSPILKFHPLRSLSEGYNTPSSARPLPTPSPKPFSVIASSSGTLRPRPRQLHQVRSASPTLPCSPFRARCVGQTRPPASFARPAPWNYPSRVRTAEPCGGGRDVRLSIAAGRDVVPGCIQSYAPSLQSSRILHTDSATHYASNDLALLRF